MLNNVPAQVRRSGRLVVLKHPNSMNCSVWKKVIQRDPDTGMVGTVPNIGGAGVLDVEDEADYEYEIRGDAKILFGGIFDGSGSNWNDIDSGIIGNVTPVEAQIECVLDPSDPDFFIVDKQDRITVEPGGGIVLVYEVIGESSQINIPPYTRKYILAQQSSPDAGVG